MHLIFSLVNTHVNPRCGVCSIVLEHTQYCQYFIIVLTFIYLKKTKTQQSIWHFRKFQKSVLINDTKEEIIIKLNISSNYEFRL